MDENMASNMRLCERASRDHLVEHLSVGNKHWTSLWMTCWLAMIDATIRKIRWIFKFSREQQHKNGDSRRFGAQSIGSRWLTVLHVFNPEKKPNKNRLIMRQCIQLAQIQWQRWWSLFGPLSVCVDLCPICAVRDFKRNPSKGENMAREYNNEELPVAVDYHSPRYPATAMIVVNGKIFASRRCASTWRRRWIIGGFALLGWMNPGRSWLFNCLVGDKSSWLVDWLAGWLVNKRITTMASVVKGGGNFGVAENGRNRWTNWTETVLVRFDQSVNWLAGWLIGEEQKWTIKQPNGGKEGRMKEVVVVVEGPREIRSTMERNGNPVRDGAQINGKTTPKTVTVARRTESTSVECELYSTLHGNGCNLLAELAVDCFPHRKQVPR